MVDQHQYSWPLFRRFLILCLGVGTVLLLLTYLYRAVMLGLVISAIISYIAAPGINYLCERLPVTRKTLVAILIFLVVTICTLTAVLGIPYIYQELLNIVQMIPAAMAYGERLAKPLIDWARHSQIVPDETIEAGFQKLNIVEHLMGASDTMQGLFSRTPKVLEAAFNLAMVPLFTYLMLADKDDLRSLVKNWTPKDLHPLMRVFIARIDSVLRAVVKGQFLVAFVLSIFYMAGFSLIDLPSGIAGICRVVPYFDVLVGLLLSSIVILTQGSGIAVFIGVLIVIAVVQSLDGMIITPRIIGDRAGLHPIVVIASVFSFGHWFGLLGVLLAVPIVAASVVALQIFLPYLQNSPFYRLPPS
jgi:predicted PurR-regulated permease PerM